MQRVFSIVTGITISEYVRKRRLSLAYEELKLSNDKIIDIAIKYGYESSIYQFIVLNIIFKKNFYLDKKGFILKKKGV